MSDKECNCGWGGVHDPDNPRCEKNSVDIQPDGGTTWWIVVDAYVQGARSVHQVMRWAAEPCGKCGGDYHEEFIMETDDLEMAEHIVGLHNRAPLLESLSARVTQAETDGAITDEMVERAARASFEVGSGVGDWTWDDLIREDGPERARIWRQDARTILQAALQIPSPGTGNEASERRAPVQSGAGKPAGSVSWAEHLEAWAPYGRKYNQSAERIAERGGFGYNELLTWLGRAPTTWAEGRIAFQPPATDQKGTE